MKKVFIDGKEGTTGLGIFNRLESRTDIELLTLPENLRKDTQARRERLNACDVAILCLPDDAAREAVSLVENEHTVIIDASTAHRTLDGWVYGFPELSSAQRDAIRTSKRIAVPGCHASGFIALVRPLVEAGFIENTARLVCHSLTGYSGGGKKMIAQYESQGREALLSSPRQYGITQNHKHLKEMVHMTHLEYAPIFCPIVADFYSGMEVTVGIFKEDLKHGKTIGDIKTLYRSHYAGGRVVFEEADDEAGFLASNAYRDTDDMHIAVYGNESRMLLVARYDNLGKGASGAAAQCLDLVLGQ